MNTNQLTADGTASYSFDANGNRTMAGYATSTGNRTTNDGTWTYTFDDSGNEIKKSKGAAAETWNFLYDHRNQLIAAEKHATDGGTLLAKVLNKYDALGDRIERDEDADGNGTYETVERFAYDGWKVHQDAGGGQAGFIGQENFDVWADLNGSNVLTTRRLFGDNIDQIVARISSGGTAAWYYQDRLGSVRNLVDATGTLQETLTYDGFGNILTDSSPTFGDRYKYTAREWDSLTKLQGNRARWYDAETGKWITTDQTGFAADDTNLYRYAGNETTLTGDPSGLAVFQLAIENATNPAVLKKKWGFAIWPIRWRISTSEGFSENRIKGVIVQHVKITTKIFKVGQKPEFTPVKMPKVREYYEFWEVSRGKVQQGNTLSVADLKALGATDKAPVRFNDVFGLTYSSLYGTSNLAEPKFQTEGSWTIEGEAVFYEDLTLVDMGPRGLGYILWRGISNNPYAAGGLVGLAACNIEGGDPNGYWAGATGALDKNGKPKTNWLGLPRTKNLFGYQNLFEVLANLKQNITASNKVHHMLEVSWTVAGRRGDTQHKTDPPTPGMKQ